MTGFFEETAGVKSMTRLMSFLALLFAFFMVSTEMAVRIKCLFKEIVMPTIDSNFLWLTVIFIAAAFCPKVIQKMIEMKFGISPDDHTTEKTPG